MKNGMSVKKYLTQKPDASTTEVMRATGARAQSINTMRSMLRKQGIMCNPVRGNRKAKTAALIKNILSKAEAVKAVATPDVVNHPSHYTTGGVETIDFIEAKKLNYNLGNAIKYITRADHKGNRLQDLQKAKWYLEREILSAHI